MRFGPIHVSRHAREVPWWAENSKEAYAAVLAADPGQLDAANNLAWLLVREENQVEKAYHVLQDARTRKGTRPPLSGRRTYD